MGMYYIRNEGYLGNALIWWQQGGGYTCDINNAEIFTEEQARQICKRPEDSAYRVKYIDNLLKSKKTIIDSQYVDSEERLFQ